MPRKHDRQQGCSLSCLELGICWRKDLVSIIICKSWMSVYRGAVVDAIFEFPVGAHFEF